MSRIAEHPSGRWFELNLLATFVNGNQLLIEVVLNVLIWSNERNKMRFVKD